MPRKIAEIRREEIADALRRVLARDGLSVPSYDAIAGEGGMSRQLVRHYYRFPERMAADLAKRLTADVVEAFEREAERRSGEERLVALLDVLFGLTAARGTAGTSDVAAVRRALEAVGPSQPLVADAVASHDRDVRELLRAEMIGRGVEPERGAVLAEAVVALAVSRAAPGTNARALREVAGRLTREPD